MSRLQRPEEQESVASTAPDNIQSLYEEQREPSLRRPVSVDVNPGDRSYTPPTRLKPQVNQDRGVLNTLSRSISGGLRRDESLTLWQKAREQEVRGNTGQAEAYRQQAVATMEEAQRILPEITSYDQIESAADIVPYITAMVGMNAPSIARSAVGGGIGSGVARVATRNVANAATRNLASRAGGLVGAGYMNYDVVRGGIVQEQETDPRFAGMSLEEKERAATLTALGSSALEGVVPGRIGSRALGRMVDLAPGRAAARQTLRNRVQDVGSDMLQEGLTEVLQSQFEETSLDLQAGEMPNLMEFATFVDSIVGGMAGAGAASGTVMGITEGLGSAAGALAERYQPATFGSNLGALGAEGQATAQQTLSRQFSLLKPEGEINEGLWNALQQAVVTEPDNFSDVEVKQSDGTVVNERRRQKEAKDLIINEARKQFGDFVVDEMLKSYGDFVEGIEGRTSVTFTEEERQQVGGRGEVLDVGRVYEDETSGSTTTDDGATVVEEERISVLNGEGPPLSSVSDPSEWEIIGTVANPRASEGEQQLINRPAYMDSEVEVTALQDTLMNVPEEQRGDVEVLRMDQVVEYTGGNAKYFAQSLIRDLKQRLGEATRRPDENRESIIAEHTAKLEELESALAEGVPERALSKYAIGVRIPPKAQGLEATLNDIRTIERATEVARLEAGSKGRATREQFEKNLRYVVVQEKDGSQRAVPIDLTTAAAAFVNKKGGRDFQSTSKTEAKSRASRDRRLENETLAALFNSPDTKVLGFTSREQALDPQIKREAAEGKKEFEIESDLEKLQRNVSGYSVFGDTESTARDFLDKRREVAERDGAQEAEPRIEEVVGGVIQGFFGREYAGRTSVEVDGQTVENVFLEGERQGLRRDERQRLDEVADQIVEDEGGIESAFGNRAFGDTDNLTVKKLLDPNEINAVEPETTAVLQEIDRAKNEATQWKEKLQGVRKDSIARAKAARKAGQKSYEVTWHDGTKRTIQTKDAPAIHAELQVEADSMFNLSKRMENMLRHVDEKLMELRQGEVSAASAKQDDNETVKSTQEELDKEAADVKSRRGGPSGQKSQNELSNEQRIVAALQLMNYNKERSAKVLKKVARAWGLKRKLSEASVLGRVKDPVERELLRQSFALLSDETGASANVNSLDAGSSTDAVYVVVNDVNNYKPGSKTRARRYLNTLTSQKMGVVLSGRTKKSVAKDFAHIMEGYGYIQHPQHTNVFLPKPNEQQIDAAALTNIIDSYNNALDRWGDGERVLETVEQEALREELRFWLHHVNYFYGGWPKGFKKQGQSAPINIPKKVKKMFSNLGYEFKRGADGVVYIKRTTPKPDSTNEKAKTDKVKGKSKTSAERQSETLSSVVEDINDSDSPSRKQWARELNKQRQAQRAAWEAVSDWRSKGARKHIYRWLRSLPQSEWGQRALTDLHRGVANNNVRRQIIKLVEDGVIEMDAADRKLFDEDPNFAVAVAWQAWVANQVKLGPKTDTWYYRITEYLMGLFNLQRRSQFAEAFMARHRADGLFEPESFKSVYQDTMSINDRRLHDVMRAVDQGYKRFLRSNYQVLVDYGLVELADALHNEEARVGGRKNFKLGFLQAREKNKSRWHQRLNRLLGPTSDLKEGELLSAWEDFIKSKYTSGQPTSRAGRRLHTLFDEIYEYMGEAGSEILVYEGKNQEGKDKWRKVPANKRVHKVPFIINLEFMRSNQNQFRDLIAEHGNMDQETAQKVVDSYLYSYGVLSFADDKFDEENPPYSVGSVSGLLDGITPDKYKYFQQFMRFEDESQLLNLLTRSVNQSVHRAEFDRSDIRTLLGKAMTKMEARGLPKDEQNFILNRTIPSMLGTLQNEMNPGWRTAQQVAMSVINYSILPMILFSSVVDIMGPALRTGEMNAAWRTFKTGIREIRNSFTGKENADLEMAKMFGIIEDSVLHARIGDAYDQDITVKWTRKMNNAFFKYTGMDGWTIGTRVAAMKLGMDYINKHQGDADKLAELGLKKSDLKKDADGEIIWSPENDQLAQGLFRFVDSAVLRPTGAHKPAWGGDPRFMLIWHLKHFMFTFHKVFTERVVNELNQINPNYRALMPYLSMVPVMMTSDFVRNLLVPSPYYDRMGFFDAVYNSVRRSGVLGLGTFALDALQDVSFRQAPGTGFMGPAFGVGHDLLEDGLGKTLWRLLPGYVLWSKLDNHF